MFREGMNEYFTCKSSLVLGFLFQENIYQRLVHQTQLTLVSAVVFVSHQLWIHRNKAIGHVTN